MRPRSPSVFSECPSPPLPPTAASIAAEHFAKELALHQSANLQSRTVVIVHDACYGHRFSRPKTSKAGLESIVERPERLHSGILGMAAAYVRMGKRWGSNRYAPHPELDLRSLPVPPFQIRKTTRMMPLGSGPVTHVHGTKWMAELKMMCEAAESRLALNGKELVRPNSSSSTGSNPAPRLHEGDLYLCPESLDAFQGALGGVCDAVDAVFGPDETRRAFVCIRPPGHHCSSDYPSGFCWLNNVHVGIAHAAMAHGLTHAAIIDFDLHHGDGSQSITWEQNQNARTAARNSPAYKKTRIGYFSLHDINSYPCEDGDVDKVVNASVCVDNAHGQSIWNVHLEPWKDALDFWRLYNTKYIVLLDKARAFLRAHSQQLRESSASATPKAAIFLSAGFDASEWEGAGMQRHKVNVPTDFYAKFTSDIMRLAGEENLDVGGRIISVLEGGYSDRALTSGILSHLSALADTRNVTVHDDSCGNGLAGEMVNRFSFTDASGSTTEAESSEENTAFDTLWWSLSMLEELEALAARPPPPPIQKPTAKGQPNFLAHTHASAAKAVVTVRDRRGSALLQYFSADEPFTIPEVNWALATVELLKAIIPTDRQTLSYQHIELKGESGRTKRERHSLAASTDLEIVSEQGHMKLRERKPKVVPVISEPTARNSRPASRTTRRTTIASASDLLESTLAETQIESAEEVETAPTVSAAPKHSVPRKTREGYTRPASSRPVSRAQGPVSRPRTAMSLTVPKQRVVSSGNMADSSAMAAPPSAIDTKVNIAGDNKNGTAEQSDVDKIVTGVKKLNLILKVPTPEEHAAREAARMAEERRNANKAQKKASAGRTTRQPAGKSAPKISRTASTPAAPRIDMNTETIAPSMTNPRAGSSPVSPTEVPIANSPKTRANSNGQQAPGQQAPGSRSFLSPPLTPPSLQPRSQGTAFTREHLPVFTSTSKIPFGSSAHGSHNPS